MKAKIVDNLMEVINDFFDDEADYTTDPDFVKLNGRIAGKIVNLVFVQGDAFEEIDHNYWLPDCCWEAIPKGSKKEMNEPCDNPLYKEQPKPITKSKSEIVLPYVIDDLETRVAKGIKEYGSPLQTHNGRKPLRDAYEEVLDMAMYLRQYLLEIYDYKAEIKRLKKEIAVGFVTNEVNELRNKNMSNGTQWN